MIQETPTIFNSHKIARVQLKYDFKDKSRGRTENSYLCVLISFKEQITLLWQRRNVLNSFSRNENYRSVSFMIIGTKILK
jgi:hypothetical protein